MAKTAILFLAVDAIPYAVAHEAWCAGDLPGFREPLPMVSVFPSLTNVAVPALLGDLFDTRPLGYEARYYDPHQGKVCGGFSDDEAQAGLEPFHGGVSGLLGHGIVYLLRRPLAYAQARWITHQFVEEGGPWLGYISATDGVAHFGGRDELVKSFRDICHAVTSALDKHGRTTGQRAAAVLCSDHGMAFGRFAHLSSSDLEQRLRAAGFSADARGRDRAVLVALGDVGGGIVHVDEARAVEVAAIVADAPGVDLAFGKSGAGCVCVGKRDGDARLLTARIAWRGDRYLYEQIDGDPLGYAGVWEGLEQEGMLEDGWAADRDLFAATWSHAYPDALARVRGGLQDLVRYPATVLFSMKQTYTYGPPLTHLAAELIGGQVATHGALGADESVGFAACTDHGEDIWRGAPALRPGEVLRPWRELVRAGAARNDDPS